MIRKVVKVITETRIVHRAVLECTHLYSRPIPKGKGVKTHYFCHSCNNQKNREELGFKPQKGRRKNK